MLLRCGTRREQKRQQRMKADAILADVVMMPRAQRQRPDSGLPTRICRSASVRLRWAPRTISLAVFPSHGLSECRVRRFPYRPPIRRLLGSRLSDCDGCATTRTSYQYHWAPPTDIPPRQQIGKLLPTAHAGMGSHNSKQQEGTRCIPPGLQSRPAYVVMRRIWTADVPMLRRR
jgi:hypothetical protein